MTTRTKKRAVKVAGRRREPVAAPEAEVQEPFAEAEKAEAPVQGTSAGAGKPEVSEQEPGVEAEKPDVPVQGASAEAEKPAVSDQETSTEAGKPESPDQKTSAEAEKPKAPDQEPNAEPEKPNSPRKRWTRLASAIVAVVMAALAVWFTLEARNTNAVVAHNTALSDAAGTADVGKQISAALGTLFSYRYDDPAKNEQAAKDLLTGPALAQYSQLFGQVRKLAADQKLVVTSTAVASGVKLLDGDRAALLAFLDQTGTRGDGQHSTGAAQLSVTAERTGGKWRITGMSAV